MNKEILYTPPTKVRPVTEEDVRTRAYFLWEAAGRPDGRSDEFWELAQHDLAGPPIHFFAEIAECPPPLAGLMRAVSDPEFPPEGLPEWASFTPGWNVRHERPGDSMPPVVRFGDDAPRRTPNQSEHQPAFVGGHFTAAQIAMDPAQAGRSDRTVECEWELNPEGGPILRDIRYVEATKPVEAIAVANSPEAVAGRLLAVKEACERDSEKLKAMLAKRRAERAERARAAVIAAPTSPAWQRARELVDPQHWDEFYSFVQGATVSKEFTEYLHTSEQAKAAITGIFDEAAVSLQHAIGPLVGTAPTRRAPWFKRLIRWLAGR